MLWQSSLQRSFGEMRHPLLRRHCPHINQQADRIVAKQLDKLVERSGRVPDRQDYGLRCDGSTAGTSTRLVSVWPFSWYSPEKRNAGS